MKKQIVYAITRQALSWASWLCDHGVIGYRQMGAVLEWSIRWRCTVDDELRSDVGLSLMLGLADAVQRRSGKAK